MSVDDFDDTFPHRWGGELDPGREWVASWGRAFDRTLSENPGLVIRDVLERGARADRRYRRRRYKPAYPWERQD